MAAHPEAWQKTQTKAGSRPYMIKYKVAYAVRGRLFLISKNCVPVWLYLEDTVKVK